MRMWHRSLRIWGLSSGALALTVLAGPAGAKTIYSWQTEDGGYAFTDDAKQVPPRYRDAVVSRKSSGLEDYARFTAEDAAAADRYADRLAARLERLRAFNAPRRAPATGVAKAKGPQAISLRTGGPNAPSIDLTPGASHEPVIVERISGRPSNSSVTRDSVVVRQGDRTIAILRSRRHQWNLSDDIVDEDEIQ